MSQISGSLNQKYEYVGFLANSVRIKEKGFWGINDFQGNEILPSSFIEIFTLASSHGLIAARDAGFWDIFDFYGNKLNSERYEYIYPYYGLFGMSKVRILNKWGMINKYGKLVIPIEYKRINKFGKGVLFQKEGEECEFIERKELIKLTEIKSNKYTEDLKKPFKKIIRLNTKKIKDNLD